MAQQRARPVSRSPRSGWIAAAVLLVAVFFPDLSAAQQISDALAARLSPEQQRTYAAYSRARSAYERDAQNYWAGVDEKREGRRRKRGQGQPFTHSDYIAEQPPKYTGPQLAAEIAKIVAEVKPPEPDEPLPGVSDFLAAARQEF